MERVELLTVEESFQIDKRSLVIIPDFVVPDHWKDRAANVTIVKPDGSEYETIAKFSMAHFNIKDPKASIDRRWRVVVMLPDRTKAELPVGSKILVSEQIRNAIVQPDVG